MGLLDFHTGWVSDLNIKTHYSILFGADLNVLLDYCSNIKTQLGAAWSHVHLASVHSQLRLLRAALRLAVRDEI